MDNLPIEIISQIVRLLKVDFALGERLSPYTTVSRRWLLAVEAETFHTVYISPKRMEEARKILSPERLFLVKQVFIFVFLPRLASFLGFRRVHYEEHDKYLYNKIFVDTVTDAFELLATNQDENARPMEMSLIIQYESYAPSGWDRSREVWLSDGNETFYLEFLSDERLLPELPRFIKFTCDGKVFLSFDGSSICRLVSRLPNLEECDISLIDYTNNHQRRIDDRIDLALSLDMLPQSISDFNFKQKQALLLDIPRNYRRSHFPEAPNDALSIALRKLYERPNMFRYSVLASVDPNTLIPARHPDRPLECPKMEYFSVFVGGDPPIGETRYGPKVFEADKITETSQDSSAGVVRNGFEPYIQSAALVTQTMPRLKEFYTSMPAKGGTGALSYHPHAKRLNFAAMYVCKFQQKTVESWRETTRFHNSGEAIPLKGTFIYRDD